MSVDTLWYTRCPVPTAFSAAVRLGWIDDEFARDKINIVSLLNSSERAVRESHFAHTQPDSFRHGGNIPPIWAFSQGNDVRLIALSTQDEFQPVLVRPDSDIRTVLDLKGRKLSLPRRKHDSIDFWRATVLHGFISALSTAGLTERDVELVEVPIERAFIDDSPSGTTRDGSLWSAASTRGFQREEAIALLTGKVDAIFSHGAHAADIKAFLGARVVIDLGKNPDRKLRINNATPLALTASGKLIERNPELVARWLANVIEAAEWAKSHHDETFRIIAAETGTPEEITREAYGDSLPDSLVPDLSVDKVEAIGVQKKLLLDHGFIKKDFDVEKFIARGPLEQAQQIVRDRAKYQPERARRPANGGAAASHA
ncbi:MAG: ABC transporter substrate-binding protein [Candidatus Binatus sp.]|jgi:ABC-type nitrate/sulfonate/bicarbonate transport system substrate-binding protein